MSLAACSAANSPLLPPIQRPPDYKLIIGLALRDGPKRDGGRTNSVGLLTENMKLPSSYAPFEISQARQVQFYAKWVWQVCLKGNRQGNAIYIAVFISGTDIIDARTSVVVDECERQSYEPFPQSENNTHDVRLGPLH
jgi:hypothetical protein